MDCDICYKRLGAERGAFCPSCAHALLYESRIEQVTALLEREKSHTHAEAIIRPGNDGVLASLPDDADLDAITSGIKAHNSKQILADTRTSDFRVDQIVEKAEELRKQIEEYRAFSADQKEANARRWQQLASNRKALYKQKARAPNPLYSATNKISQKLEKVRTRIEDARLLLCREAATASNLKRRRGTNGRTEYSLAGLTICDLRDLHIKTQPQAKPTGSGSRTAAEPHELVTGSLDGVARVLTVAAHYLSIRLPAELLLPRESLPRAFILPEKSSYKHQRIDFPGPSNSRALSPLVPRRQERNMARPRNLWLDVPLVQLYRDDPKTFGLYVEGVMLLAWNLAWLCKTQGFDNINTFEDVCAVGRNLWQLLMTQRPRSTRPSVSTPTSTKEEPGREIRLGQFSHNSAHSNLAAAEGLELFRDWKFSSSTRLIDKLKSQLMAEISGAEWDLLEEREWDEEREDELPVLVGGLRQPQESKHAAMSIMAVAPPDGLEEEQASASDGKRKEKGNSGWMKVRGRADAS